MNISYPVFYDDLVYKLRRIKGASNFVSSSSKTIEHLQRQKYDAVIIAKIIGRVLAF